MSDSRGEYTFPQERLAPGTYRISIRAAGYDLASPDVTTVTADETTRLDVKLRETDDLAAQLMNGEWMTSFPGTPEDKRFVINCNHCHSLEITARSGHTAEQWVRVLERMRYANGASLERPFRNPHDPEYAAYWGEYAT